MPSAANGKSEKPASSEATDNSPVRQIMTVIEHKIRNLEKRKSKLTSYRDLQKGGKELNSDQKVAVAKYEEVAQTLEFARDLSKQIMGIAVVAEREAKKQAKKEAWVRYAAETGKIKEVLLIMDCLMQMGNADARDDFLNGTNGACKLTEDDLKILDDLYPEVTPKHEINEEGQPGFHIYTAKAAEHLYAIIDGRPKEILGTTYAHIKEIVTSVHECGYFDKGGEAAPAPAEEEGAAAEEEGAAAEEEEAPESPPPMPPAPLYAPPPPALPVPPAAAVVPAPGYPLRPLPPITLQEVEHAYFAQQYPQQRPIAEVIGSQNFFFLQESEIDSPAGTPQPPGMNQHSPPAAIPTQTFTNQHFVQLPDGAAIPVPPQPHFPPPHAELVAFAPAAPPPAAPPAAAPPAAAPPAPAAAAPASPPAERAGDEWAEGRSPERRAQGQGDGQARFKRYGRGGRGASNGFRGRGAFQGRQGGDYHGRHGGEYQSRSGKDGYQSRQYNDGYQSRHGKDGYQSRDGYYGNGDAEAHQQGERGEGYAGYRPRGGRGPRPPRAARPPRNHYRKPENVE